jgi:DNA polymerase-3 subunit epsilon
MLKNISLAKPLAVIDLETTGTNPRFDRIVEISVLKLLPEGAYELRTRRLNPGMPIPPEATAVHGIADADVAGEPRFEQIAGGLLDFLNGCDLGGFNLKRFDLPLLRQEFARAGRSFSHEGLAIVDAMEIFHACEPRDLSAAVRFFLGREHERGHSAEADALATAQVLDAMLTRYAHLPRTVDELHQRFKDPDALDADRKFIRANGEIKFNFGVHRGQPLAEVARRKPDYLRWMLNEESFREDAKAIVRQALADVASVG